jgi:hypothetical protein
MKRRVAAFAEEGKWTSGPDATMLIGDWQAWVDGDGHWKVRGPDPDNEAHYADGDVELTEAEYIDAGNSEARRKIRARRAKEAARAYIKTTMQPSKRQHATKKSPAQLQREINEALASKGKKKHVKGIPSLRQWDRRPHGSYAFHTPEGVYAIDPNGRSFNLTFDAVPVFGGLVHDLGTHRSLAAAVGAASKHYKQTF